MRRSRNNIVANVEGLSAESVLASFAQWIDGRLSEAMLAAKDLAFRDRPFDIVPGRTPALVGWEHMLLEPGAAAPRGRAWTVYRLQAQPRPGQANVATMDALPRDELADLLDTVGIIGVFDGTPARASASLVQEVPAARA